ncbi:MAG TPA: hypothetical protein PKN56_05040 [Leptospiraceae bacterium]|nr:hypothetical protein [Leptospiraceae bacterium]HNF23575.1 hypothetical protein [Leptospiraceae bacterium]HNI98710.1 hypothetical protein [Leptospiraceae bacterium]HNM04355.1 hypothetical protein [Leptospiraceae bacterium]HNN02907.1 hypothetical protein [Leptospiraceae bacterium]
MSQTALPVSKSEKLLEIFSLLSPEKQDQVLDFIEFLHKKYDPAPGDFGLHPDLQKELLERLREYEENPEDVFTGEEVKAEWEEMLGRKIVTTQ